MNYSKKLFRIMGCVGLIIVIGTVGYSDYQNAIGEYVSFTELVVRLIIGLALMTPVITRMCGGKRGK